MKEKVLGIDIGGTKIHIAVVQEGTILQETKLPTSAQAPKAQIIAELKKGIEEVISPDVAGIGIGVLGLVDEEKGIVYGSVNIPSWQEVHLKEELEAHFKKPVFLTNDANSFVLGEKVYGKAQSYRNLIGVSLGTGLGAGVIINDDLYSGTLSSAGELGSIPYLDKTIEDYCSGKFFQQTFGRPGYEVMEQAQKGEAEALEILQQYGHHLGNTLNLILFTFSPQAILLGGSVSRCFPFFKEAMYERIQAFPFQKVREQVVIDTSSLDNAAILGAAALFQLRNKRAENLA